MVFFSYPIFYRGSPGLQFLFIYYFPLYKTRTHTLDRSHIDSQQIFTLNRFFLNDDGDDNNDDKCTRTHTTIMVNVTTWNKKQLMLKINLIVPVAAIGCRDVPVEEYRYIFITHYIKCNKYLLYDYWKTRHRSIIIYFFKLFCGA